MESEMHKEPQQRAATASKKQIKKVFSHLILYKID